MGRPIWACFWCRNLGPPRCEHSEYANTNAICLCWRSYNHSCCAYRGKIHCQVPLVFITFYSRIYMYVYLRCHLTNYNPSCPISEREWAEFQNHFHSAVAVWFHHCCCESSSQITIGKTRTFSYARLKNRSHHTVAMSVHPPFRLSEVAMLFSTCFEISIWNLVYNSVGGTTCRVLVPSQFGSLWSTLQPKVGQTHILQSWPHKSGLILQIWYKGDPLHTARPKFRFLQKILFFQFWR